jgi:O-antigen biosynthesis protein
MKKVKRKLAITYHILKNDGVLELGIRSLQFVQKKTRGIKGVSSDKHKIYTSAYYDEILIADPKKPANKEWLGSSKKKLTVNWLMPPPGKGSGGHMTIFRFIKYLEDSGHTCRIYLHKPGKGSTVEAVQAVMGDAFPNVKASMQWLEHGEQMAKADAIFATSWETAYTVYASKLKAKRFYFVQDFEPFFYPVGGLSILAENTYRLGLRGITAGGWLAKKLHDSYGMQTDSFWFGSDKETYHYDNLEDRKSVTFYARPTTERRAFELGILTLDLFHKQNPDYAINFIGWDVSEYDIPFPYNNLGILSPDELNDTYNRSSASLVMSLTNMSLLPLELLGSGCIPVVNKGENNTLVSDNPYIEYSDNDPVSLATALTKAVKNNTSSYAQKASKSVSDASWDDSGKHFVEVVVASVKKSGTK